MLTFDTILLVLLAGFVFFGFFFGFIHTLGSLVGAVLGIVIGMRVIDPIFDAFGFLLGGGNFARVVLFIIIFFVIARLVGFVFWILDKTIGLLAWLPFIKTISRLLGAALGFVEGVLVLGGVLFYATNYLSLDFINNVVETSQMAQFLLGLFDRVSFLVPEAMRVLNEVGGTERLREMAEQGVDKLKDLDALRKLGTDGLEKLRDWTDIEQLNELKEQWMQNGAQNAQPPVEPSGNLFE